MIEPSIWNQINVLSQKNPKQYLMKNVDIKEVNKEEETITNKNENIKIKMSILQQQEKLCVLNIKKEEENTKIQKKIIIISF